MADTDQPLLVLPRPGAPLKENGPPPSPISAPTEALMTSTFGSLLPPATYLTTPHGRAAYYVYPPLDASPPTTTTPNTTPERILLVHGIQTPALGLHPLATALRAAHPRATVATFDHWGHGLSDTPVAPHSPPLFYGLLDAVLAALGWASAHLVGYSFGASTVAGYVASTPARARAVASVVLVAPAGLFRAEGPFFTEEVRRRFLRAGESGRGSEEDERAALDWIVGFLEGGALVVPGDWRERVARGEVVAEAVKAWEMRTHEGHAASVVAIVRDGAVMDNHAAFVETAKTGVRTLAVLGELDDLCSVQDLHDVGFKNVVVVPAVGHGVVRQRVPEVAQHIGDFWKSAGQAS